MASPQENVDDLTDAECQERCESFATITNTNTALAQTFLQDRSWNLERSLADFFDGKPAEIPEPGVFLFEDSSTTPKENEPTKLTVITWNIDGLDESNLKLRTKAVCKYCRMEGADIILLQEVVPTSLEYIKKYMPDFSVHPGNDENYFAAILINKNTVKLKNFEIIDFNNSSMGRNLLRADVEMGSFPFCFFSTHLESTAEFSEQRKKQLSEALTVASKVSENKSVILAGDLNLRDKELVEIGGLPSKFEDVWIMTGKRKECSYTWDMTRNDNLRWAGSFKPRCRFDRMFFRKSTPAQIKPIYFGLIGLERLKPHVCFPSDHWGIISRYEVIPKK